MLLFSFLKRLACFSQESPDFIPHNEVYCRYILMNTSQLFIYFIKFYRFLFLTVCTFSFLSLFTSDNCPEWLFIAFALLYLYCVTHKVADGKLIKTCSQSINLSLTLCSWVKDGVYWSNFKIMCLSSGGRSVDKNSRISLVTLFNVRRVGLLWALLPLLSINVR